MLKRIIFGTLVCGLAAIACADAPVVAATPVDTSAQVTSTVPATTNPAPASLTVLQQQVNNLTKLNIAQQISQLQQQNQSLTGQVQVLQHDMKTLNDQLRNFYQDLDKRITQIINLNPNLNSGGATPAAGSIPAVQGGTKSSKGAASQAPKTTAPASPSGGSPGSNPKPGKQSAVSGAELSAYQSAFELVTDKKYTQAEDGLQAYLNHYPKGEYAPNATYWLGEVALMQKNIDVALTSFQQVAKQFPKSAKVPDAEYKIALILLQQGKNDLAGAKFKDLKQNFPNSTAAQLASIRLQQLQS